MTKKLFAATVIILMLSSFIQTPVLKGTWIFAGGIYNGKPEGAPTEYSLHRNYNDTGFEAFMLEKGEKPLKYQTGNYILQADTCMETETFNIQSARLTGITIHYHYTVRNDSLILNARLPTGMLVEEYWKRLK